MTRKTARYLPCSSILSHQLSCSIQGGSHCVHLALRSRFNGTAPCVYLAFRLRHLQRAGVECPEEAEKYVKALRHQLADHSVPFSPQKFVPHITLVRGAKGTLRDSIAGNDVSMMVKAVCLMRSDRGKTGMNYTEIGRVEVV